MAAAASTREGKSALIGEVKGKFDKATSAVFLDYKGMTVEQADQAPRAVPQGRRRVQGRQEHARQAGPQGARRTAASWTTSSWA